MERLLKFYLPVACKTPSVRKGYTRGGGWGRFKYPKKQFWNSRKAGQPARVGVKVAPDSGRIGGSGRVNRPVRVRLPVTEC